MASASSSTEREDKGTVIGIDLGTTFTCVGVYNYDHGRVDIIENNQSGLRTTPSCIAINKNKDLLIGDAAKKYLMRDPTSTAYNIKRFIGREWHDESIQKNKDKYPFEVVNHDNRPAIKLSNEDKLFTPEEISAILLQRMKENAEEYLGEIVTKAVITVPAYFNDAQRQATKDAGKIAGLDVLRIINEPEAAALAYSHDKLVERKKVLIFDLGGGKLDACLMDLDKSTINVLATSGNTYLGGEDFDQSIVQHFVSLIRSRCDTDVANNAKSLQKLKHIAEIAKCDLSLMKDTTIELVLPDIKANVPLSRTTFEELNKELFVAVFKPIDVVLEDSHMQRSAIDEILLLGGSSRIPRVQNLIKGYFGKKLCRTINASDAVVRGATIYGTFLKDASSPKAHINSVNQFSLGFLCSGNKIAGILPRNKALPTTVEKPFVGFKVSPDISEIVLYEGESSKAEENYKLGYLPFSPKQQSEGVEEFDMHVDVGFDGLLVVRAVKDVALKKVDRLSSDVEESSHRLDMYANANVNQQELAKIRNSMEINCYLIENALHVINKKGMKPVYFGMGKIHDTLREGRSLLDERFSSNLDECKLQLRRLEDTIEEFHFKKVLSACKKSTKQ